MEEFLKALGDFLTKLIQNYGPGGALAICILIYILFVANSLYQDWRKDKEVNLALQEKERAVQALANDVRMWRTLYLKDVKKWTDEQCERFLILNDFRDPKESREFLEKKKGQ